MSIDRAVSRPTVDLFRAPPSDSPVELDGSLGEGGGQILRTALALSVVTGRSFVLSNIRAGRARPGLLRQHLTGVLAAAEICGAEVMGAALGSAEVWFEPGPLAPGDYQFDIGSAGSAGLVLQTVLPPLLLAAAPSTVVITGGTHNSASPSYHFLEQVFAPHVGLELMLHRFGFYPAGGGRIHARVNPGPMPPIRLVSRGEITRVVPYVASARVPVGMARRALDRVCERLELGAERGRHFSVRDSDGPGFVMWIEVNFEGGTEIITSFGEKRVDPDVVADAAVAELEAWRDANVPVGEHLADQLLIPLALFGGEILTGPLSEHTRTNLRVIEAFLPGLLSVEGGLIRGSTP